MQSMAKWRVRRQLAGQERQKFSLDHRRLSDQFDIVLCGKLSERQQRTRNGGPGGEVSPHGIHGDACQRLRFLRGDSLHARVVATLTTHAVRTLHRAALRARLDDDRGGGLVRVAGALSALGGATLRYGHGILTW